MTQVLSLKPEMAVVSYSSECIISFGSIYVSHIPYEQLKKKIKAVVYSFASKARKPLEKETNF